MFIDTHTHLHNRRFNKDREDIIRQMEKCNIQWFIEMPIDYESNSVMREKLKDISNVRFAAGIHPTRIEKISHNAEHPFDYIIRHAHLENTVAIGEVGLDHHIPDTEALWKIQEGWFHRFIELAQTEQLPMVLHIRQAYEDAVCVLREHGNVHKGVVHCFDGGWEEAKQYLNIGLYLGVGGFITMGNLNLEDAVRKTPLDFIILETDCPFVTPKPFTGRNTPLNIPNIAQKLADIKGISVEEVEYVTTQNAIRLFELNMNT